MSYDNGARARHPVDVIHRVGAAVLGLGLLVFAVLGFVRGLSFFSTQGQVVLGLSSNGLLSTISVVAGAILLAAAAWRGPAASTTTAVMGGLFLLSGLGHLAILHTALNVLAFRLPNVFFSIIVGMLLLFLGLYGRLSGGLPPDNPYRRAREERRGVPETERSGVADTDSEERAFVDAEVAMAEGHPTAEQQALVEREQQRLREREHDRIRRRMTSEEETNTQER